MQCSASVQQWLHTSNFDLKAYLSIVSPRCSQFSGVNTTLELCAPVYTSKAPTNTRALSRSFSTLIANSLFWILLLWGPVNSVKFPRLHKSKLASA